ncbi:MAG TPA: divalent-cation tolerance protein CutA [Nitrososphaeraceae archaeon]
MKVQDKQSGIIIISTFPAEESTVSIVKELLNKKLCACVNLMKVRSVYHWDNKLEDQEEYLVLFKCTTSTVHDLKSELKRVHPYEVPEIVEIRMNDVSDSYLSWMTESTIRSKKRKKR